MTEAPRPLRVAVIGSGPAGIYAADLLTKSEEVRTGAVPVAIDIFDRYPAPFGLIRYGVAPDHPRIKGIITALHKVLDRGDIRFFGNVEYGKDLSLADLREHYDAVIFATGAIEDAKLPIPGIDLDGSYGASDFVSWYDGHPDYPRTWPLKAEQIAVLGNGNVALDVARVLSKHAEDLLVTEIPENVYEGLKVSPVTDVHVFGRRGPAQMKFTPLELRELAHSRDVDIVLYEEDFVFDAASEEAMANDNQVKVMMKTLNKWLEEQKERTEHASRRLHLHFMQSPVEILGEDGAVTGLRVERNELDGKGGIKGTGEYIDYPMQAIYRAIGYFGSELPEIGFDPKKGVITNVEGRVVDEDGNAVPGLYATGWIKRGPVGLIGSTKSDALETITHLLSDRENLYTAPEPDAQSFSAYLDSKGIRYTTWEGWHRLDEHEKSLGAAALDAAGEPRARVKVVDRDEMVRISCGE
ncbi:MAG: FAD-dependent oxidoreductase [Rothia sp. (in: high G+C Gram-positive bacteria)]|uniref:FAD-dependent oxidoreductase n=1 Tax=Rothia sp. (in: high G+C Gram-positive bacteria) TaxID=1885016 RepID=UPI0026E0EC57|nr:FAD-dependent oxidoreductase [Rothia sp. (in: high G+C Gram-positive bacteria)]MDO5750506.1 FAD-dependent oxidoreductase [Rothia sp. (in: high G+C Gram-positive bacteria)]